MLVKLGEIYVERRVTFYLNRRRGQVACQQSCEAITATDSFVESILDESFQEGGPHALSSFLFLLETMSFALVEHAVEVQRNRKAAPEKHNGQDRKHSSGCGASALEYGKATETGGEHQ